MFGIFYHPPDDDAHSIAKFCYLLTSMPNRARFAGDFNLPGFKWCDEPLASNGSQIHSMLADMIVVFIFEQYIKKTTRANADLNLILCNCPVVVSEVAILPGISDYCEVVAELSKPGKS